jgi:cardiolipin synthase
VVTIFRDVMMVVVGLVLLLALDIRDFPPSVLGKATTFFEIATVVALLVINLGWLPPIVALVCFRLVLVFVVVSGLHYTWKMLNRLPSHESGEKS